MDKNADYPDIEKLKAEQTITRKLLNLTRQIPNNIVEQNHRFIKKDWSPAMGRLAFNEREANLERL